MFSKYETVTTTTIKSKRKKSHSPCNTRGSLVLRARRREYFRPTTCPHHIYLRADQVSLPLFAVHSRTPWGHHAAKGEITAWTITVITNKTCARISTPENVFWLSLFSSDTSTFNNRAKYILEYGRHVCGGWVARVDCLVMECLLVCGLTWRSRITRELV